MAGDKVEKVRTFIAVELPEEVRRALSAVRAAVEKEAHAFGAGTDLARSARWVRPEGTHLTLKFLGWTPEGQVPDVEGAVYRACVGIPPFHLVLRGVGAFPSLRRARVLWVGVTGDLSVLTRFQRRLEEEIAPLGFPAEARDFHPHLTLARLESGLPAELCASLGRGLPVPAAEWPVEGISLMRSELLRGGARYTQLAYAPLQELDKPGMAGS